MTFKIKLLNHNILSRNQLEDENDEMVLTKSK